MGLDEGSSKSPISTKTESACSHMKTSKDHWLAGRMSKYSSLSSLIGISLVSLLLFLSWWWLFSIVFAFLRPIDRTCRRIHKDRPLSLYNDKHASSDTFCSLTHSPYSHAFCCCCSCCCCISLPAFDPLLHNALFHSIAFALFILCDTTSFLRFIESLSSSNQSCYSPRQFTLAYRPTDALTD
ncbi:hypothetical protein GQ42DRAFT_65855 [Ramicandelaber brevisporus]|nr:hypothetical protein GQ42DRAFT_65855 [Ramicandelaber brevisporus]